MYKFSQINFIFCGKDKKMSWMFLQNDNVRFIAIYATKLRPSCKTE